MSSQLKEKKEQQQPLKREERADFLFNQHIVRTIAYTAAGFGVGMLASLLFKHKAGMTLFFAGTGAGYGGANFVNDLTAFRRNRNLSSPTQIQGQQNIDQRRFERRDDDRSGNIQQAKENVKQGAGELSSYMAGKVNQAARGVDEAGRNLAEKAKKEFSRDGDDSKEKKSSGPGKTSKDKNETVNIKGQTFQSFQSNPFEAGPLRNVDEGQKNYQANRNKAKDPEEDEKRRRSQSAMQDRGGVDSIKKVTNTRLPNDPSAPAYYGKASDIGPLPIHNQQEAGYQRDKEQAA